MSQDAAAAVGALGLLKIKDYGNPTKAEIDRLFKILTTYKKAGPVPRLLVGLHRLGELHGLEGGRDRVDVVAGRGARQGGRRQHPLRGPARGLPRLVQRRGHLVEGHATRRSCRPATTTSTGTTTGTSAPSIMRQGYYIANGQKLLAVDQLGRRQEGRLHAGRVRLLVGRQGGPDVTCPASPARSATSRRASRATVARSRSASASTPRGTPIGKNSVYLTKRVNDFLSA